MARLVGVDIPNNKQVRYSLQYIFGIGDTRAVEILTKAKVALDKKVSSLTDSEFAAIREAIMEFTIEGDLRREIAMNIKHHIEVNNYRGSRHRRKLPVRGQRTKTNARTVKGPRKTVANKKVESK